MGANLQAASLLGADLRATNLSAVADFRGAKGIECSQLSEAKLWETAHRDETLACGMAVPVPHWSIPHP